MSEITIRAASRDDVQSIVELWIEFMDFHGERDPWFKRAEWGHMCFAEFIMARIEDGDSTVLVADVDGETVGYALMTFSERLPVFEPERTAAITDVAVAARLRRKGVGHHFVHEMLTLARERGVTTVQVSNTVSNEVSTAFWRKMGFVPYQQTSRLHIVPGDVSGETRCLYTMT